LACDWVGQQGTLTVSWEKVGKALVGLLVMMACAAALYAVVRKDDTLVARLTYSHLTYPGQFNERISQANELLKYERLQARIRDIGGSALGHVQLDKLVELAQAPYLQLFARPFEAGLVDHRTGLLIELTNHRQAPVTAVQVRLPAKGLVQIRNESGDDRLIQPPTATVEIAAIEPGGTSTIWVYFDADYSQIRQGGITIGHADGSADIEVYREVVGLPAWAARYSRTLIGLLVLLGLAVLVLGYRSLMPRAVPLR
jgi:hypothetical protein